MSVVSTVTVTVPATTANLGPGFDCIGAALTLYNEFKFTRLTSGEVSVKIIVNGLEADRVNTDDSNLAYQSFLKLYQHIGETPPPVEIEINLNVPLARGLGSSATAIMGGLVGANQLALKPIDPVELLQLAIAIEGHPDNVVPAFLGGCRLAVQGIDPPQPPLDKGGLREDSPLNKGGQGGARHWEICDISWHENIVPVVAIPDFELSTAEARRVLPTNYSRADAIFNTAHLGLLVKGLETGRSDWLRVALQDKIHQPYRQTLIKGYNAVQQAALAAGAYGMVISGAGPTLLALADVETASDVAVAMADAWKQEGVEAQVRSISIDDRGTRISLS